MKIGLRSTMARRNRRLESDNPTDSELSAGNAVVAPSLGYAGLRRCLHSNAPSANPARCSSCPIAAGIVAAPVRKHPTEGKIQLGKILKLTFGEPDDEPKTA